MGTAVTYLDDNGQPIQKKKVYLDDSGKAAESKPAEEPSLLEKAWGWVNNGLLSGRNVAEALLPGGSIAYDAAKQAANAPPGKDESPLHAAIRVGTLGAATDTADTASGFTSPLSLGTLGLGAAGKIPGAVGKLARATQMLSGAGFGLQGAAQAAEGLDEGIDTPEGAKKALGGVGQAILGATGVREGSQQLRGKNVGEYHENLATALPKATDVPMTEVATPEVTKFLREEAVRQGKTSESFTDKKGSTQALKEVVDGAKQRIDDVHDGLLKVSGTKPGVLPAMNPHLEAVVLRDVATTDPAAAQRIEQGQPTMNDVNLVRMRVNKISSPAFDSGATYNPAIQDAAMSYGKTLRNAYYSRLEQMSGLPKDEMADLKKMEGGIIELSPYADKLNAQVQNLNVENKLTPAMTKMANRAKQIALSPLMGPLKKGIKVAGAAFEEPVKPADTARYLGNAFRDLPTQVFPLVNPRAALPASRQLPQQTAIPLGQSSIKIPNSQPSPTAMGTRAQRLGLLLPEPSIPLPASHPSTFGPESIPPTDFTMRIQNVRPQLMPPSFVSLGRSTASDVSGAFKAKKIIVRDPKTGRMKIQYLTEKQ